MTKERTTPAEIIHFWQDAGPAIWFSRDDAFDAQFRRLFLEVYEKAARGELDHWMENAEGALALMILLDQFPRNAFRDSARMYATDEKALSMAERAIASGYDRKVTPDLRLFFYMPFEHSEDSGDQARALELIRPLGGEAFRFAEVHADIIARFGRFPHRNQLLGRHSTPEELAFLAAGGFAG